MRVCERIKKYIQDRCLCLWISLILAFVFPFFAFYMKPVLGNGVFAITFFPIATSAFLLGSVAGLVTAFLLSISDLIITIYYDGWQIPFNAFIMIVFFYFSGFIAGYFKDLTDKLNAELIERKKAEGKVKHLAYFDTVTGLPNRLSLVKKMEEAIDHHQPFTILFLDLDRFKDVNDSLGHEIGDKLLKQVAQRISRCIGKEDMLARFGGDEFAVFLLEKVQMHTVNGITERISGDIKKNFVIQEKSLTISVSIGSACYPKDGENAQLLLKNADIAMYRAKQEGRGFCRPFDQQLKEETARWYQLANDLIHAVQDEQFLLHYQPFIELKSGRIVGTEALIRWNHPTLGLIWPGEFIPIAEKTGQIEQIGEWVLREAVRQNKIWNELGFDDLYVAVNVSARQFQNGNFLGTVSGVLREIQLKPGRLELEVTENVFLGDVEFTIQVMEDLKAMGVSLSIDDFGTGYSCLGYLRSLPMNTLKISRSFVMDLPGDLKYASIIQAIVAMAKTLRIQVVAEGVEEREQLDFIRGIGCDIVQGYYYSKPVSAGEMQKLLQEGSRTLKPGIIS